MTFDLNLTITSIIAIAAVVSPIFVAKINTSHQESLRDDEMEHETELKQLEMLYNDKKNAFETFLTAAGKVTFGYDFEEVLENLNSTAAIAMLHCSKDNKQHIINFVSYANQYSNQANNDMIQPTDRIDFSTKLSELSYHLNIELKSTIDDII